MERPQLAPVPDPEPKSTVEIVPAPRPAPPARRSTGVLAALPKPAVAVGGVAIGALLLRLFDVVDDFRRERRMDRRTRSSGGPLIAIMSDRIRVDLRPRRRLF